jgi:hypothetical protein
MKLESLVIADQHAAVNTFSGLVHTARHTMRAGNARSRWPNRKEGAVEGRTGDWGQVVTRYPYENVGMDHLLSKEKEYKRSWMWDNNFCSVLRDLEGFLKSIFSGEDKFFEN